MIQVSTKRCLRCLANTSLNHHVLHICVQKPEIAGVRQAYAYSLPVHATGRIRH